LPAGKYLDARAANISVATTSDPATTQTPDPMTLEYIGIVPSDCVLVDLYDYSHGHMGLLSHWQTGKIKVVLEREGTSVTLESDDGGISNTAEERVAVRFDNNASGSGGTITFLRTAPSLARAKRSRSNRRSPRRRSFRSTRVWAIRATAST
jgi:hypothetical protein